MRLWDTATGAPLASLLHLPDNESAALDASGNDFLSVTSGAWRHFAWRHRDPTTGRIRLLPAEHFGPLPVHDAGATPRPL